VSQFKVEVVKAKLEKHSNADTLSVVIVGGWQCVVKTADFEGVELGAYIPIDSIVPDVPEFEFLRSHKFRVKTIKLRGLLSQGLLIPAKCGWYEGDDVTEELGVKKYEPPEMLHFGGELIQEPAGFEYHTDIEQIQNYPSVFVEGEDDVIVTEKIHGTNARFGLIDGVFYVGGHQSAQKYPGVTVYAKVAEKLEIEKKMRRLERNYLTVKGWVKVENVVLYGEIYGRFGEKRIQSLDYGRVDPGLIIFDVQVNGKFLDWPDIERCLQVMDLQTPPVLYEGKFIKSIIDDLTEGKTVLGNGLHLKEGVVIRARREEFHPEMGRKWLKRVSNNYLLKE